MDNNSNNNQGSDKAAAGSHGQQQDNTQTTRSLSKEEIVLVNDAMDQANKLQTEFLKIANAMQASPLAMCLFAHARGVICLDTFPGTFDLAMEIAQNQMVILDKEESKKLIEAQEGAKNGTTEVH